MLSPSSNMNTSTITKINNTRGLQKIKKFLYRYDDYPKSIQKGKYAFIIFGILIPILHFFVFYLGINLTSILLAFQETKYVAGVGEVTTFTLKNFQDIFRYLAMGGSQMGIAVKNTIQLFFVDLFMMVPIFIFAYCFSRNMKGSKFFRVVMYLPTIISGVAFSTMITSILQDNVGALDVIVNKVFGVDLPGLFTSYEYAWPSVLGYCIWAGVYANLLILEGSIRRVSNEVVEAAMIDGAGTFTILTKVVIPGVWGTLSTLWILKVAGLFTISGPILLLTGGAYNTQTLNYWFYETVAVFGSYNLPAAGGIVFTILGLPIVWIFRKIMNKISDKLEY